ncbi:MAG: CRISPR system precrRNA processing endoribonuclease RAMP protein Cas6 [Pseudonocardiaceae bacterium]
MPAVLDLELSVPTGTQVYSARLHGAACALLEKSNAVPHTAQHKPFSVGPLFEGSGGRTHWRLGWLEATEPPQLPAVLTLGPARCKVQHTRPASVTFTELLAGLPVRHAELHFVSPTFFARKGRDLPLPDPVLIMRSLASRWDAHAPAELALPATELSALLDTVYLHEMAGETRRAQVSRTMWQTGFVGAARLALTRAGDDVTTQVFTALTRFAEFAGVGAQTTHGFGAVRLASPQASDG